jgi:hypothetical protein
MNMNMGIMDTQLLEMDKIPRVLSWQSHVLSQARRLTGVCVSPRLSGQPVLTVPCTGAAKVALCGAQVAAKSHPASTGVGKHCNGTVQTHPD